MAPTKLTGSNAYNRSALPVLPSAHILPFGTSCLSTVHGPPATRVMFAINPVELDTDPPHVTSGLQNVVMLHVLVVPPSTKVYGPFQPIVCPCRTCQSDGEAGDGDRSGQGASDDHPYLPPKESPDQQQQSSPDARRGYPR